MIDQFTPRFLQPWRSSRRAFSLIELVIALALSVVLISAIYAAISLHWKYETLGRERINRSQLSLAIIRKLSEDVGCVMFSVPKATTEDEDSSASSSTSTASSSSTTTTATQSSSTPQIAQSTPVAGTGTTTTSSSSGTSTASSSTTGSGSSSSSTQSGTPAVVTPTSLGITGTSDYVQLDVNLAQVQDFIIPVDTTGSATTSTTVSQTSDLVRVTWMLITPKLSDPQATGIASLVHNPALARYVEDRLQESLPEGTASSTNTNSSSAIASTSSTSTTSSANSAATSLPEIPDTSVLAREVVSLQFRYYDGYAWVTDWNSSEMGRLPRAIEVTMGFLSQDPKYSKLSTSSGMIPVTTIKHVIQVPASTPVSGSEI